MLTNALGEIEVLGLAAAIEAADVAVKAANVRLIGYETTDGAGMVTVKVEGQVSSVSAAVAAAAAAAARVSTVFATSVIPRPSPQLGDVVLSPLTVGLGAPTSVDRPGSGAAAPTPPEEAPTEPERGEPEPGPGDADQDGAGPERGEPAQDGAGQDGAGSEQAGDEGSGGAPDGARGGARQKDAPSATGTGRANRPSGRRASVGGDGPSTEKERQKEG